MSRIFDRAAVTAHRDRAAAGFARHDFLFRAVGARLVDRLADVRRRFPRALDLGAKTGLMAELLADGTGGIETLIQLEPSAAMLAQATGLRVQAHEDLPPIGDARLDLVLSNLALHWADDLPGALAQIRRALKPDGLFLGAVLGGETLAGLRHCLLAAEAELRGGAAPRVSPVIDPADAPGLLQRAGFALPLVDVEVLTATWSDPLALMRELRGMGETNAQTARDRRPLPRAALLRACALYQEMFGTADGRVEARFQVIHLSGWAPAPSQPRPLPRGSGQVSLAAALEGS